MRIYKFFIAIVLASVHLFFIQSLYDFRDNSNYLFAFERMLGLSSIDDAFTAYKGGIGASEPVLLILYYVFADLYDYVTFNNLINLVFLMVLYLLVSKFFKRNLIAFFIIVVFDYYIYKLTGELHRLKLAILFFMLYLYFDTTKYKIIAIFLSLLSHLQIAIVYFFFVLKNVLKNIEITRYITPKALFYFLCVLMATSALVLNYRDALLDKLSYHLTLEFPLSTFIIGVLYLSYLAIFGDRNSFTNFIYLFFIVASASFVVGSERINILLFEFIFIMELYYFLEKSKMHSLIILVPIVSYNVHRILDYFSMASIG